MRRMTQSDRKLSLALYMESKCKLKEERVHEKNSIFPRKNINIIDNVSII